jgi:hypothetical protein
MGTGANARVLGGLAVAAAAHGGDEDDDESTTSILFVFIGGDDAFVKAGRVGSYFSPCFLAEKAEES